MRKLPSHVLSWLAFLGLIAIFVGERLLAPAPSAWWATGPGLALLALAILLRVVRLAGAKNGRRFMEQWLLVLYLVAAAGVGMALYLGTAFVGTDHPKLSVVLTALFPALITIAFFPVLLGEMSYASMANADTVETGRLREALYSGLGLSFLLIFSFATYYVASERDAKVDLSFFRTAKPGEATIKIVRALDEPVTVTTFFPPANEVASSVDEYLSAVAKESPNLKVVQSDVAMEPAKARDLGVSGNGAILVQRGGRKEQLLLGTDLDGARSDLARFDADFQKRLLAVTRAKKTIYLAVGHGERGESKSNTDRRAPIRALKDLIEAQNHTVKTLSAAEGLASEIPSDAAAVLVIGPEKALLPEEAGALTRYLQKGGRVLYALDPSKEWDAADLLKPLGLELLNTPLANDQAYLATANQLSDRGNIATFSYSSHPSVTTDSQLGRRAPMVFMDSGALQQTADRPKGVTNDFTVHAQEATWNDVNQNFVFDAGPEVRKKWELAAAVTVGEGRALVTADSDLLSDPALTFDGNYYFALDGVKWLLGDEATAGAISSEQDVPIQHTRKQDVLWFYSTIFVAPAAVLIFGYFQSRRRRSGRTRS